MLVGDASYRSHQTFLQFGSSSDFGFWIIFCISYCTCTVPLLGSHRSLYLSSPGVIPIPRCPLLSGPSRRRPPGKRLTSSRPRKLVTAAGRWDANQAMCTGGLPWPDWYGLTRATPPTTLYPIHFLLCLALHAMSRVAGT